MSYIKDAGFRIGTLAALESLYRSAATSLIWKMQFYCFAFSPFWASGTFAKTHIGDLDREELLVSQTETSRRSFSSFCKKSAFEHLSCEKLRSGIWTTRKSTREKQQPWNCGSSLWRIQNDSFRPKTKSSVKRSRVKYYNYAECYKGFLKL